MNCREAKKIITDLKAEIPENDQAYDQLRDHISNCDECRMFFEAEKRLSHDFESQKKEFSFDMSSLSDFRKRAELLVTTRRHPGRKPSPPLTGNLRLKPLAAVFGIIFVLIITVSLIKFKIIDSPQNQVYVTLENRDKVIEWNKYLMIDPDTPVKLTHWNPPDNPGIFVIMHKPDPENSPDTYRVDYLGESGKFAKIDGYPWIYHKKKRLLKRSGSEDNIYISIIPMPNSTRLERKMFKRTLENDLQPFFNRKQGA